MKRALVGLAAICAVAVGACGTDGSPVGGTPTPAPGPTPQAIDERVGVRFASATLRAEVADAPREWAIGLMHRTSLGADEGMLFVFDTERSGGFWMKDTLIPLSIAFMRSTGDGTYEVVDVLDMQPCPPGSSTYPDCPSYTPTSSYDAALEAGAGWFADAGIGSGDSATVER